MMPPSFMGLREGGPFGRKKIPGRKNLDNPAAYGILRAKPETSLKQQYLYQLSALKNME